MSLHRFFLDASLPVGDSTFFVPLSDADVHHLRDVLRVTVGEEVELVDASGAGHIVRIERVDTVVTGSLVRALDRRDLPRVTLFQGIAKGDKMDTIVRQAIEVGAEALVPVMFRRCVVRLDSGKAQGKADRWRRIARSASEQAHRNAVVSVMDPVSASTAVEISADFDLVMVCWEESEGAGIRSVIESATLPARPRIAVVVGPEGGLDADEVAEFSTIGASIVTLGPTVLRTETAAVVATALAIEALSYEEDGS